MYAMYLDNRRPDKDGQPSRMQRHSGRIPDFGDKKGMTPHVFGCSVVRLRDENERANWKGAGRRVADGTFVGIHHTSYMVYNHATGRVTFEPFIWVLDELELARTGAAAGAFSGSLIPRRQERLCSGTDNPVRPKLARLGSACVEVRQLGSIQRADRH